MRQLLRKTAIRGLGLAGLYPTTSTNKADVLSLIEKLRPKRTRIELTRLGPKGDGGYLVPNDLLDIEACFSPGVSYISGFEKDCAERGMRVFLADRSVEGPALLHQNFHFTRKHVGATTSSDFMTLDSWVESSLPNSTSDLLLQMDIEGYEYETLLSTSSRLMGRFRIIVAEFHSLHLLWSQPFFKLASSVFEKLLQTHTCVHIHPNNECECLKQCSVEIPRLMEFTFLRNDRAADACMTTLFPHPLDSDNSSKASLPLPKCWYAAQSPA